MRERKRFGRVGQQGMRDIQRGSRGNPLEKNPKFFDNWHKRREEREKCRARKKINADLSSVLGASDKEPTTWVGANWLSFFLAEHDL